MFQVPGYTGYIPKSEKYFGKRYANICDKARHDLVAYDDKRRQSKGKLLLNYFI